MIAGRRRPQWPNALVDLGGMARLGWVTLCCLRPPYPWAAECVSQFRFVVRVCFFPLILCAFALSFGPAGVQAVNFFGLFGAFDRMGGIWVIVVLRLFSPLVVGIVLAGAAGTAVCADLGARVVREEIDAMRVLGIEPVRRLIVPRVVALAAAGVLFTIFAVMAGMLGAVAVLIQNDAAFGPFFSNFFANATPLELLSAILRAAIYGVVIGIVCCYRGIMVSGGSEGVGRAVNRSIVICFLLIGFIDYFFSQLLLATQPELSQVRG